MDAAAPSIRARMTAASWRIGRLKRADRAAVVLITSGGIAVVVAVMGILVFIAAEALPLFRPAVLTSSGRTLIPTKVAGERARAFRAIGADEYRKFIFTIEPEGRVALYDFEKGVLAQEFPVPGLGSATVTATSRSLSGNYVAAGLSEGRLSLMQIRAVPNYQDQVMTGLSPEVRERAIVDLDPAKRPVRQVSYLEQDGAKFAAAAMSDREVIWWSADADGTIRRSSVYLPEPQRITQLRIGRSGALVVATDRGNVFHWDPQPELHLTDVSPVSDRAVTAIEWVLGGNSWVAGTEDGGVSAWFRAPVGAGGELAAVRAHTYARQSSPVVAIAMSGRERSFATIGRDGSIVLRHFTSERSLATASLGASADAAFITPKADRLIVLHDRTVNSLTIGNPHPEISWKVLFGKVWYEGYPKPEYVWQSTGATDDFESKLSLVPLIFGTIKGTLYAMLFAIPLAVVAALFTSQFAHPKLRSKIKPTVEIMAALPSVVIGFLAGLYLATVVEKNLVAVILIITVAPIAGTSGVLLWRILPNRITTRLKPGSEIAVIAPILLVTGWLAIALGPVIEAKMFGGDARFWLSQALGFTYDQRNCLVVGLAMGFAVIPIIFTISEDAFSSVPSSLTAASLALGASRWQTAVRVVLPTASPGVFSAIMVGFGRAVGETMIVLMATGNTPLMDWSIFNGIRTLAANIAVEIPESPQGGTLYRTLFLTAALLFILTFIVNTIAEIVRQRLRDRYKAI